MAGEQQVRLGERIVGEDWYAAELIDASYVDCIFRDVDLTEAVTRGSRFERCQFATCRFNASTTPNRPSSPASSSGPPCSTRPSGAAS